MSSNFVGVTFAQQRVTPADDAQLRKAILADGVLSGCKLSYSGSTLTMAAGHLIACGRQFRHLADEDWSVSGTTGYARLLLTIDLTKTSTETAFEQIFATIEYCDTQYDFPDLVKEDINNDGTQYQMVLCVVSLGADGITEMVAQMKTAAISRRVEQVLLWENPFPYEAFPAQDIQAWEGFDENYDNLYDRVMIDYIYNASSAYVSSQSAKTGDELMLIGVSGYKGDVASRQVEIGTAGKLTFKVAYHGTSTAANSYIIPVRIYGIRGVTSAIVEDSDISADM